MTEPPLWRDAFDAAERRVTPHAERLVRTPGFAIGAALVQRAQTMARSSVRGASARAWHLLNLPAGSDVSRLRSQIGALDREVRRLTVQLELERRRPPSEATARDVPAEPHSDTKEPHANGAQPADRARPRAARRRAERPAES
ncbi:hypothetical protein [Modestobacter sp. VKM Ac-2978]|uniref:hypothetical protein n=1 Tax=Modestobacter sp. VKM Ac-2978 TaxID=3004132 RepID=UPI0022AAC6EE|nr:hypothetical protein [Modestobacter sp. VKM Ac-2978]MCZ2848563.1 hypothetical protein [Modestobacter sp. VKM Ac-2978]